MNAVRLAHEIVHAGVQQLPPLLLESRGGHGHDLHVLAARELADLPGGFDAIHHRHAPVHPDELRVPVLEQLHASLAVLRQPGVEADVRHQLHQQQLVLALILGDEDAERRLSGARPHTSPACAAAGRDLMSASAASSTGSSTRKMEPLPGVLATPIEPPMSSTNWRVMVSPRPVPFCAARLAQLHERLEQAFLVLGLDADAGVLDLDQQMRPVVPPQAQPDGHAALPGELHRIAGQIDQDLAQPRFVALDVARKGRRLVQQQPQAFFLRAQPHHIGDVANHGSEVERRRLQLQPPGLDLGHLQHVVDEGEQMLAAAVDDIEPFPAGWATRPARGASGSKSRGWRSRACAARGSYWRGTRSWPCWPPRPRRAP